MKINLTEQNVADLKSGNSIIATADTGKELGLFPSDFEPPMWALMEAGGTVTTVLQGMGNVETHLRIERAPNTFLIVGNIVDGMTLHGPFTDAEAAIEWANANASAQSWVLLEAESPESN